MTSGRQVVLGGCAPIGKTSDGTTASLTCACGPPNASLSKRTDLHQSYPTGAEDPTFSGESGPSPSMSSAHDCTSTSRSHARCMTESLPHSYAYFRCVDTPTGRSGFYKDGEGLHGHSRARARGGLMNVHHITGVENTSYGMADELFGAARSSSSET